MRIDHELKVKETSCKTNVFSKSFFPNTIREWNRLPRDVVNITSNDMFVQMLHDAIV